jgi:hypothetical protein
MNVISYYIKCYIVHIDREAKPLTLSSQLPNIV